MNLGTMDLRRRWWAASLLPRLTGPIFDKEMRVSSRRRRNYVLRFLYIGLFTFLVASVWLERIVHSTSSVYQASRMAAAGLSIVTTILWFQFLAAQAIAVVMLSTSISDEIYKRTLGVLMTTPIGSFQIVIGKLASRLLQIVLLLAISLPLLAVVRVFGGVPWDFLLCGLCVTLTTVVFVGSLSLFFSIFTRQAYAAIIQTILTMGFLFGGIPVLVAFLTDRMYSPTTIVRGLSYVNPFVVMMIATEALVTARAMPFVNWPLHCAVMSGLTGLLLLLAMIFVRKAALRQAGGIVDSSHRANPQSTIRRVQGPPVLWKERRAPLFGRRRLRRIAEIVSGVVILGLLLLTYGLCHRAKLLRDPEIHVMYGIVFFSVGILFTVVLPATCITTEKESRTWSLLLTTTVGNWEILWGKFAGAVRRCLPAWVLLFAHTLVFMVPGIIHPVAVVHLALLAVWVMFFLTSTGLYFSTRLRHTTTAVIANLGLAAGLWAIFPLFLAILLGVTNTHTDVLETYMDLNPFVHAGVIMNAAAHKGGLGMYDWMQKGMGNPSDATGWMALTFAVYASVGLAFLTRAASRLRLNPF